MEEGAKKQAANASVPALNTDDIDSHSEDLFRLWQKTAPMGARVMPPTGLVSIPQTSCDSDFQAGLSQKQTVNGQAHWCVGGNLRELARAVHEFSINCAFFELC